jgi:hypothetical protein
LAALSSEASLNHQNDRASAFFLLLPIFTVQTSALNLWHCECNEETVKQKRGTGVLVQNASGVLHRWDHQQTANLPLARSCLPTKHEPMICAASIDQQNQTMIQPIKIGMKCRTVAVGGGCGLIFGDRQAKACWENAEHCAESYNGKLDIAKSGKSRKKQHKNGRNDVVHWLQSWCSPPESLCAVSISCVPMRLNLATLKCQMLANIFTPHLENVILTTNNCQTFFPKIFENFKCWQF